MQLSDYHECLKEIMSSKPVDACYFNECKSCPNIKNFKKCLSDLLVSNIFDTVMYILSKTYQELVNKTQTIYYSSKFILPPSK